jgi:DNA-binding protein HU-beta
MLKDEFIKAVAEKGHFTKASVASMLTSLTDVVREELKTSGESRIPGMGCFKLVDKAEKKCHNPRTGEPVIKPAHTSTKFKISKTFLS